MRGVCRVCDVETEVVVVPILYDKGVTVLLCDRHKDLKAGGV